MAYNVDKSSATGIIVILAGSGKVYIFINVKLNTYSMQATEQLSL